MMMKIQTKVKDSNMRNFDTSSSTLISDFGRAHGSNDSDDDLTSGNGGKSSSHQRTKRNRTNSIAENTFSANLTGGRTSQLPLNAFAALSGFDNDDEAK